MIKNDNEKTIKELRQIATVTQGWKEYVLDDGSYVCSGHGSLVILTY